MSYMKNHLMEMIAEDEEAMINDMKKTTHACKRCGNIEFFMAPKNAFDIMFIICDKCE